MKTCKICGEPLMKWDTKENRTEHYKCRRLKLFKKKVATLEKLSLANGKVLIEKTAHRNIYKVLKIAKNVNYIGLGKSIEVGDLVVCAGYMYSNGFKLGNKEYFLIKPTAIAGYFA